MMQPGAISLMRPNAGRDPSAQRRVQGSTRSSLALVIVSLVALASGCASLMDTPAQGLARDRWTMCHARVTGAELNTVMRDGRISFWYNGTGDGRSMLDCLRDAARRGLICPSRSPSFDRAEAEEAVAAVARCRRCVEHRSPRLFRASL